MKYFMITETKFTGNLESREKGIENLTYIIRCQVQEMLSMWNRKVNCNHVRLRSWLPAKTCSIQKIKLHKIC
jgi:hypothetical protein